MVVNVFSYIQIELILRNIPCGNRSSGFILKSLGDAKMEMIVLKKEYVNNEYSN